MTRVESMFCLWHFQRAVGVEHDWKSVWTVHAMTGYMADFGVFEHAMLLCKRDPSSRHRFHCSVPSYLYVVCVEGAFH